MEYKGEPAIDNVPKACRTRGCQAAVIGDKNRPCAVVADKRFLSSAKDFKYQTCLTSKNHSLTTKQIFGLRSLSSSNAVFCL